MKTINVKTITYINSGKEINDKDPKFKIGDIVRISKYKIIFVEGYIQNWSEEDIVIKEVKNAVPSTYVRGNQGRKLFSKNKSKMFRVEKVIKRKGDKLYVKWEGYGSSFDNWIDKKDIA